MNIMVYVHSLKSEGGTAPFRSSALDGAMQTAERIPGVRITAVAVDGPGGREAIRAGLALAADEGLLLPVPGLSPYDSAALGRLLADGVRAFERERGPVDAVFCGDADPGQDGLGPALAGSLGWPQVTGASRAEANGEGLTVWRNWDDESILLRVETPCVISFLPSGAPAGYPLISRLMAANQAEIPSCDIQAAPELQQILSFSPSPRRRRTSFREGKDDVEALVRILADEHMI